METDQRDTSKTIVKPKDIVVHVAENNKDLREEATSANEKRKYCRHVLCVWSSADQLK